MYQQRLREKYLIYIYGFGLKGFFFYSILSGWGLGWMRCRRLWAEREQIRFCSIMYMVIYNRITVFRFKPNSLKIYVTLHTLSMCIALNGNFELLDRHFEAAHTWHSSTTLWILIVCGDTIPTQGITTVGNIIRHGYKFATNNLILLWHIAGYAIYIKCILSVLICVGCTKRNNRLNSCCLSQITNPQFCVT